MIARGVCAQEMFVGDSSERQGMQFSVPRTGFASMFVPTMFMPSMFVWAFLALLPTISLGHSQAFADGAPKLGGAFELEVRTIRASESISADAAQRHDIERTIDSRIRDLQSKLEQLHYTTFKLLAAEKERVIPRRKTVFSLADGHRLAVKPLYIENNRVGVWMRWVDREGVELLDTRMHLACGESIITGTDREGGEGMVIAIRPANIDANPE